MKIYWLGHSGFLLECGKKKILIDPFVNGNGQFPVDLQTEIKNPDYILITHGHMDHLGDSIGLYNPQTTKVLTNTEICSWLISQSVTNCVFMDIGGSFYEDDIQFTRVEALHGSSITAGEQTLYGGIAGGFIIKYKDTSIYHFGDTGIFENMKLIQKYYKPNIGFIPIGDRFTMSPAIAAVACNEYFDFDIVVPIHYNTFPMINVSPEDFVENVRKKDSVRVLKPGEFLQLGENS